MHLGDYAIGSTVDFTFTTAAPDTGVPATLSGTPAIAAYVGNSTTEITAGITLSVDFDARTGFNHVRAVLTTANGYADDSDISFVITAGTVSGNSAVGYVVGRCTIGRAARAIQPRFGVHETTIASLSTQTSFNLTGGSGDDDAYNGFGCFVVDQTTSTQIALGIVSDYTGATRTITLAADPGVFTMAVGDTVILLPGKLTDAVTVGTVEQSALADFFDTDSGTTYAAAVAGSVVKEIADNAGGSSLTEQGIADAVWDELQSGHTTTGSFGEMATEIASILDDTSTSGVVVATNNDKTGYSVSAVDTAALADFFDTDSGQTYSTAVAGSVVKEIADNAGGSSLTESGIAAAVWDETLAGHIAADSAGQRLGRVPNAAAGASGGLPTVNGSNFVAGLQGVKNTLDDLNDVTAAQVTADMDANSTRLAAIETDTATMLPALINGLNDISVTDVLSTQLTESYAADGSAPTLTQALMLIQQMLGDFSITGTTLTVRQLDGAGTAASFTLDDATNPSSITRTG